MRVDLVYNQFGAFLGRSPPFLDLLLFLVRITPATPNLVEFFGKKRRKFVIGITGARENHS
jgi:hypothetical protein